MRTPFPLAVLAVVLFEVPSANLVRCLGKIRVVQFSAVLALFWIFVDRFAGGQPIHKPSLALFAAKLFSELAILPRARPYTADLLAKHFLKIR